MARKLLRHIRGAVVLALVLLGLNLGPAAHASSGHGSARHGHAAAGHRHARHGHKKGHRKGGKHRTAHRKHRKAHRKHHKARHKHRKAHRKSRKHHPLASALAGGEWNTQTDPIDPKYLTEVPWGTTSFWIQPWRSSLTTWPASRLTNALGINFNATAGEAQSTARLLSESGFTLARVEVPWDALSYSNPQQFSEQVAKGLAVTLGALEKYHLRPLVLLNANSQEPTPCEQFKLTTLAEASAGATTVQLSPSDVWRIVPGRTGFNDLNFNGMADILITSVTPTGLATLSRPLKQVLPAGEHPAATLLYPPFGPPELPDGAPNPNFDATLKGWLSYVSVVAREAASIFGPGGYDLEVWNELTFGSQFLEEKNYYSPVREEGKGSVTGALMQATVAYVRSPASGISPQVGVSNGFASQTPWGTAGNQAPGTTAISKHYYQGLDEFPADDIVNGTKPVNALGEPAYVVQREGQWNHYKPLFVPTYDSFFPEYFLTVTQTETLMRNLSPITTGTAPTPFGRNVTESNGQPLQVWMTEYNLGSKGKSVYPGGTTPTGEEMTAADGRHMETKALLRHLVSMVGSGLSRDYFYAAANAGDEDVVEPSFSTAAAKQGASYPGVEAGGETTTAFRRMLDQFSGLGPSGASARQLQLLAIGQQGDHAQFEGNGTAAYPDLYDREVLGVFPFEASPRRFVIPVYVMTRDLATLYEPSAPESDVRRYDLPDERFRITLGNLPQTSEPPKVSAYDPIENAETPARLVSQSGHEAVFEIAATDYPRLLTLEYE